MLVDGYEANIIYDILFKEKQLTSKRHENGIHIFNSLVEVAPAMGMIGTLIGLVRMLATMGDGSDALGLAMSATLVSTLYGIFIAYIWAGPIADKLKMRSLEEERCHAMVIDAVVSMRNGYNPVIIRDSLQNYLPRNERSFSSRNEEIILRLGSKGVVMKKVPPHNTKSTKTHSVLLSSQTQLEQEPIRQRASRDSNIWIVTYADLMSILLAFLYSFLCFLSNNDG